MTLKKNNTFTAQVAKKLEMEIFSGAIPPDSPLPSTRALAERFQVSQRVILSALDALEKKDILVRQERKRVFVKTRSAAVGAREILFFTFGEEMELHSIYQAVNELILNSGRKYRYDFFSRIVSSAGILTPGRLDRELGRLENLGFIDCALFYSFMTESQLKKCMKLPYPVIFLGELPDSGKLPPGARMISPDSTKLLLTAAEYAVQQHYKELIFAYWDLPARHEYEKNAMRSMENFLKKENCAFRRIPVYGRNLTEVRSNFNRMAPSLAGTGTGKTLFATQNIRSEEFDDRVLLPRNHDPAMDLLTLNLPKRPGRIKYLHRNYDAFRNLLVEFIESCREPLGKESRHVIADYQYKVMEETI